ncbi:MAG: precorrin-6y C5,15-methyltransferase (decarboxylating) subunit CbiE [Frankiaceae bacterium]
MITVIGCDGGPLTGPAGERLAAATLVVGGRDRLAAADVPAAARTVELGGDLRPALAALAAHDGPAVVLASGDPGFFGILRAVAEACPGERPEVLPAVSSVARAFARVGLRWDDAVVVSAHGRPLAPVAAACRARPKVAVLTAPGAGPAELGAALSGSGRRLVVAARLGEPGEQVVETSPEEAAGREWPDPNVVLVLDPDRLDGDRSWLAGGEHVPAGWALGEEAFEHRDGMVTKAEVRALVLARLAPRLGSVVWDVGAGSGSVAIECARFGADVVAIERDPDQCARIRANAAAHGVTVDVVEGSAPAALAGLRSPDALFLGGGGPDVLHAALRAHRPARVVAAIVTVERVGELCSLLDFQGYAPRVTMLQAARLGRLPAGHHLTAINPVFVLSGVAG